MDINKLKLDRTIKELKNEFITDNISGCVVDVVNEKSVYNGMQSLLNKFGGLDILVSSVAVNTESTFENTNEQLECHWMPGYDLFLKEEGDKLKEEEDDDDDW